MQSERWAFKNDHGAYAFHPSKKLMVFLRMLTVEAALCLCLAVTKEMLPSDMIKKWDWMKLIGGDHPLSSYGFYIHMLHRNNFDELDRQNCGLCPSVWSCQTLPFRC